MTDLLLRKYTQHTTLILHRMICMISRRASHFELQLRDRKSEKGHVWRGMRLTAVEHYVESTYWK